MEVYIPKKGEAEPCKRCDKNPCEKACSHYTAYVLHDARFQILRKLKG